MGRREVTTNAIEGQLATAVTLLSAMREHSGREQRTTGLFVAEAKEIRTVGLFLVAGVGSEASRLSIRPGGEPTEAPIILRITTREGLSARFGILAVRSEHQARKRDRQFKSCRLQRRVSANHQSRCASPDRLEG